MDERSLPKSTHDELLDERDALQAENEALIKLNESLVQMSIQLGVVCYDMMTQRNELRESKE